MSEASPQSINRLLAALPDAEYQRLVPHLERVPLPLRQVLHKAGESIEYVYFPHRAIVSLISTPEEGSMVEVGLVGNEGIVGIPAALRDDIPTTTATVQVPDSGMRMEASLLKTEFQQGGSLQSLLLRYTQALYALASQNAACNRLHQLAFFQFSRAFHTAGDNRVLEKGLLEATILPWLPRLQELSFFPRAEHCSLPLEGKLHKLAHYGLPQ